MYEIIREKDIRNIVDLGTWNGLGSTTCFIEAIKDTSIKLLSVECNIDKNRIAIENLRTKLNDNIKLVWGSVLLEDEIKNLTDIFPETRENSEFERWHSIDMENVRMSPYVMSYIPEEIDFILFDGGEFTTYYEFQKLFERCKSFIALDDVNVSKCKLIRNILLSHPFWTEIYYSPKRNGFSIFQKK